MTVEPVQLAGAHRVEAVRKQLAALRLDALLVTSPANLSYLSGFTGTAGMALVTMQGAYLLTDGRYTQQAQEEALDWEVVEYRQQSVAVLLDVLGQSRVKRLGYEADFLTVRQFRQLETELKPIELKPAEQLLAKLRQVKDAAELDTIRRAAAVADQALEQLLPLIQPGAVEWELAWQLEANLIHGGAQRAAFTTIVASGPRSALPHGLPGRRQLQEGDLVVLDLGAVVAGYCSDLTRTVVVGEATPRQKEVYQAVQASQQAVLNSLRAGMTGQEADTIARQVLAEHNLVEAFKHSLGHGLGREVHEEPRLAQGQQEPLAAGNVVTVEPGVYLSNWGGIRIEDLVVVRENGCEVLSRSPQNLILPGSQDP